MVDGDGLVDGPDEISPAYIGAADMRVLGRAEHVPHESCTQATHRLLRRLPLPDIYPDLENCMVGDYVPAIGISCNDYRVKLYWKCFKCKRWNGEHTPQCARCHDLPRSRRWSDRPGGSFKRLDYLRQSTERKRK